MRALHTFWGFFAFIGVFILLFPLLVIPILFPSQYRLVGVINRWWAKLLFMLMIIPFQVEERVRLDRDGKYIFCPNHFSYLDIPTMGLNPVNTIFVGKNAMEKIPLFGFMYRKLHITVNRLSLRSRGMTMVASMKAIDEGKSLVIYPEGGIVTHHPPKMFPFKDGAFRTAIEKQIAIVPVTIPNNWKILPDRNPLRLLHGKVKVIFHEPIETKGMTLENLKEVKDKVYSVIDAELRKHHSF